MKAKLTLSCAVALALGSVGIAFAAVLSTAAPRSTEISVRVHEWEFVLSQQSAPFGTVVFAVLNDGEEPHDFSIGGKTTGRLQGHQSAVLNVTFTDPGTYAYTSQLDDDDRAMYGYFQVTGTATTTTMTTATLGSPSLPLRKVADVTLPGGSSRFDYESYDPKRKVLYIAHLGADSVLAFAVRRRRVAASVSGVAEAHGVLAVPELDRVYATATGSHQLVAMRASDLKIVKRTAAGSFPDGLAYAPKQKEIWVSDKTGGALVVIGALGGGVRARISLGGEAGNVKYDDVARRMLVAVAGPEQLVAIDPRTRRVTARYALPGCSGAHGVQVDSPRRLVFVACERNAKLVVVDLRLRRATATLGVGPDPDVLALDPGLHRLYVAAESGVVSVFGESGRTLRTLARAFLADSAHTVAVDPATHLVYFPLENVGGSPVLRIMRP